MLRIMLAAAALVLAGACSDENGAPAPDGGSGDQSQEALMIAPGGIGPVRVGMTVEEAEATGYFEPYEEIADDMCKHDHALIQWKDPRTDTHTVRIEKGSVISLGVSGDTETAEGVGVGSSYEEVLTAYPGAKARRGEILGSTIYLTDGNRWLGIGFQDELDKLTDTSRVQYMETTVGSRPGTFRSDCT
jgi:hypothetical protein